jgi:hypothetical protein
MLIKVVLKLNYTFCVRNGSCHLKKLRHFDIFLLSILKNCSTRMKHNKYITNAARDRQNL